MYISSLAIRNFRNFDKSAFIFKKGVNTLIGENGSGKTNAFFAIRLLIDDSLPRRSIQLRETDFNRNLDSWKGHWIIITLNFNELDASEGCQILRHNVGHMTTDKEGTYSLLFRPKREVRQQLHEMARDQKPKSQIRGFLNTITTDHYEGIFTGRGTADFLNDDIYKAIVGDFTEMTFPDPHEEDSNLVGVLVGSMQKEVSCTFVQALRDVVTDLKGYRDNPLLGLLRGSEKEIRLEDSEKILGKIKELNVDISSLQEIQKISKGIQDTLHSTVGHTYSPNIKIESSLPEDLEKLLQRLALMAGDPFDDYKGDIGELSLGGANLIFISLKLLEYELKMSGDKVAHFLLIEEPEAHIHKHIQMTLFEKYGYSKTQVIVSTHSTHLSSASKIESINVLAKDECGVQVFYPGNGLNQNECSRIERYLDAVRSSLLFAKGVLLVEGDAEMILIPNLVKKVFGVSLDELGISLINMSSAVFTNIAVIFHEDRIRKKCAILTDLDKSLIPLPADPSQDNSAQKQARDKEKSGSDRKLALDGFCRNNKWLSTHYAEHTFEVDMLKKSNADIFAGTLPAIYSQQDRITASESLLRNTNSEISGTEVLRLADKVGKGWFALILSEQICLSTHIPNYILDALAFASQDILSDDKVRRMCEYRITTQSTAPGFKDLFDNLQSLRELSNEDFFTKFSSVLPEDDLTHFIQYLRTHNDA